jgi:hypothetical protein
VAKLSSQKEYYKYSCVLCCGFSSVSLTGEEKDWADLLQTIGDMPVFDDGMKNWKSSMLSTVGQMMSGSEDFWQICLTEERYGSGGQSKINGWITAFNPINEAGEWVTIVETGKELDLLVDFDLHVNDNGTEFDLKIAAGPVKVFYDECLRIGNLFRVQEL